ncbi:MAG TPA: bifunctional phosphopantothenoylcysteine decarboxylase/phosphopantothenate--cysteine ligase CoaBC [Rhodospirillaceae bacterium]|nr:bifunctional phosphopantothenoylcysteine decarboxylase/phosphopantothenate--cysteine ligase CoaBC [Rhodospirillaceae bacterium]
MESNKRILLIISGGIAAYKSLDLIRRLRERGYRVRCVLTASGAEFVTPLSLSALSEDKVYGDLFSLTDEAEMGHIQLSRDADLLLVVPATANIMAKMASGIADDLATTALLATDKPVMVAPAMNVRMWEHAATQANLETLAARGVLQVGPVEGPMACGEFGEGRMADVDEIVAAVEGFFGGGGRVLPLLGRRALVTSGPTHEPIDPVRYIANHSSGKQGHAVAVALAALGAETTLVSGPVSLPDPQGLETIHVTSALEMMQACEATLPVDIAVCAAAVADWRVADLADQKIKKTGSSPSSLSLTENPDILATLARRDDNKRPSLVVGFAAETENVVANAVEKRERKGCDWILANDVSAESGTFGGDDNALHLVQATGVEKWDRMSKTAAARQLAGRVAEYFEAA